MKFVNQIKRIEHIDYLIYSRATGTPAELAHRLGISRSQLFQTMKTIRGDMRAPIYYSRNLQSYCYRDDVRFKCKFEPLQK